LSTSTMVPLVHATSAAICPVCFCDEVTSPVELPCGHVYCTACLQHLLRSISQPSIMISLLRCAAETQANTSENAIPCRKEVPYHTIRELLTPTLYRRDVTFGGVIPSLRPRTPERAPLLSHTRLSSHLPPRPTGHGITMSIVSSTNLRGLPCGISRGLDLYRAPG
jgi:hypothetical protein